MAGTLNALPFSSVIPAQAGIQTTWGVASRLCRDVFDQPQKPLSAKTSRHRRDATKHRGFTLVELLVAIALLSVLGLMLITSVRQVIEITSTGTARGEAVGTGASLLSRIDQDLRQMAGGNGGRLVCGQDPMGRMFIAFIRNLPEERTTLGGYYSGSERIESGYDDVWRGQSASGTFRALQGLAEVCYVMEPRVATTKLYRGIVAPIGTSPSGSGVIGDMEEWHRQAGSSVPAAAANVLRNLGFDDHYQLLADNVLYLGFEFAMNGDEEWEGGMSGQSALHYWESATDAYLSGWLDQSWPRRNGTGAAVDMDFPRAIRVTVTMDYAIPLKNATYLAAPLTPTDTTIIVQNAEGFPAPTFGLSRGQNFIRVNDEWIEFGALAGNVFSNCKRGARGTKALAHTPGADVRAGLTMSRIVTLPVGR